MGGVDLRSLAQTLADVTPPSHPVADAPLRVVLLVRQLSLGGAERQVVLLARELARRGHQVTVAAFYSGGGLEAELAQTGAAFHTLGKSGRGDVIGFGGRLAAFLAGVRPDVLYTFLTVPNLLSLFARGRGRPAILWGLRASDMQMRHYDWLSRASHALEPRLAFHADLFVANGESVAAAARARGFPAAKLRIIANGVDAARFGFDADIRARMRRTWGLGDDALVVGHVARRDPMKDHRGFIAAFAQAAAQRGDLHGVCVTSGPGAHAALRAEIAAQGLGARLIVADAALDAADSMRGFDFFCSSSAFGEGFSNVLCEALACGLPCAATDVGDARFILADAGFIVPPRDTPALAEALLKAASIREADRDGAAARARAAVAPFTPAAMAAATERAMRDALAMRR